MTEPLPEEGPEAPPPGVRLMAAVRWLLLAVAVVAAGVSLRVYLKDHGTQSHAGARYQCPMHPEITSAEPGECPICGMALEPIGARGGHAHPEADAGGTAAANGYTCPMHPEVHSPAPGRCPVCKMKLEPVAPRGEAPAADGGNAEPSLAGVAPVTLTSSRLQALGVRTAVAETRDVATAFRVSATVEAPEGGVAQVHVRAPGFVEAIRARETGVRVRAGEELLRVYSPEVFQAQSELLVARSFGEGSAAAVAAARQKLELLGVPAETVDAVERSGKAVRAFSVLAPTSGFVTEKRVVLGAYVTPDVALYEITDLSRVYIVADVFARDAAGLAVGTAASFTPAGASMAPRAGVIDLLYPSARGDTRTQRVRMQLPNPDVALRPGQYGYLEVRGKARPAVVVPRDAVVDTGRERYVFVEQGEGHFVPRRVEAGRAEGDTVAIDSGLAAGERVVASGTFLVDSESRLAASLARTAPSTAASAPSAEHRHP